MRRGGLVLLIAVPLAVLLAGRVAAWRASTPVGEAARADLERKAADAVARFREVAAAERARRLVLTPRLTIPHEPVGPPGAHDGSPGVPSQLS